VGALMRAIDGYEGSLTVRCALRSRRSCSYGPASSAMRSVGNGLGCAEWRYTVTKTNTPHIVPLSRSGVLPTRTEPLTGRGRYVFCSARSSQRPMSDQRDPPAMRRMAIAKDEMSGTDFAPWHGPSWTSLSLGRI